MYRCEQVGAPTCITLHPGFQAVALNPYVLQALYGTYLQLYNEEPDPITTRSVRVRNSYNCTTH